MNSEKRYKTLRLLSKIYNIIAALSLIIALLLCIGTFAVAIILAGEVGNIIWLFVLIAPINLVAGFIAAVAAKSLSETLDLLVELEANTRHSTELLQTIADNTQASAVILHHMNKNK